MGKKYDSHYFFPFTSTPFWAPVLPWPKGLLIQLFLPVLKIEFLILLVTSLLPSFHHAFVSLFMALPILQTLVPSQSYFHPYCLTRSGFFMLIFTLSQSFPAFCISLPRPSSQSLTLAQFPLLLYFYTLSHLSP